MVEAAVSLNFPHAPTVSLKFFQAGYCTHPQGMVLRGAPWRSAKFPATFALIEHPTIGKVLFDTGYTQRFFCRNPTLSVSTLCLDHACLHEDGRKCR